MYILEKLAEEFTDKIYITWVEGNLNPENAKILGIKSTSFP